MNDIFTIHSKYYKLKQFDKYGSWIELEETNQKPTFYFLQQADSIFNKKLNSVIDPAWMDIEVQTINGNIVKLKSFSGKYVLLNFWGEWCKPCIGEIPTLVKAVKDIPQSKIQFISFIQTKDLKKAREVIRSSNITWPQIILSDELETKFKIKGYPTNILILPDGKNIITRGALNEYFFSNNIK